MINHLDTIIDLMNNNRKRTKDLKESYYSIEDWSAIDDTISEALKKVISQEVFDEIYDTDVWNSFIHAILRAKENIKTESKKKVKTEAEKNN